MYILGIESSCDETSVAIVKAEGDKREAVANIVASQIEIHTLYGGVVPEIASRAHIDAISKITYEALEVAGITLRDIGCVAVTSHPGLIGALLVGVNFAKSLAFANNIPLVAVNHIKAHVAAAYLEYPELCAPFVALVVSGGHTSFYEVDTPTCFEEIGATRDDACGEAFDKIGRVIGMPYPGGAAIDKLAYEGDVHALKLPNPALAGDNADFSFSGLKTATLNYINSERQKGVEPSHADIAASYTRVIVDAIVIKSRLIIDKYSPKRFVLAGGVAANSHIRGALEALCKEKGIEFCRPSLALCSDNAAMVAMEGYFEYLEGNFATTELNASANDDGT